MGRVMEGCCPLRLVLLVCLLAAVAHGANCGNYMCPPGYFGISTPAAVICPTSCTTALCCVEIRCSTAPSPLVTSANFNAIADVTGCDAVAEPPCPATCSPGYASTGTPGLECVAADTWRAKDPCTPITCPSLWGEAGVHHVEPLTDLSPCDTAPKATTCPLTCLAGYTGSPVLSCKATGEWVVSGTPCVEQACSAFSLPTGMVAASSPTACTASGGRVTTLKPVSNSRCDVACSTGYIQSGSGVLSCSPQRLQPETDTTCTEMLCSSFTLPVGMVAGGVSPCPVTEMAVPAGSLRAVTSPSCGIACTTGYTASGNGTLQCSPTLLTPATTLSCKPNQCSGPLTPPPHTTPGAAVVSAVTGNAVTVGGTATANLVVESGYYCEGSAKLVCAVDGSTQASDLTVTNVTCHPIQCTSAFEGWAAGHVNPLSDTNPCDTMLEGPCPLSCATGYQAARGGAPQLMCTGTGKTQWEWKIDHPCVPIECTTPVPAAANNVKPPVDVTGCNAVSKGACELTCAEGFTNGRNGPPRLQCTGGDTWEVTDHCTALCSNGSTPAITGGASVATGLTSPPSTTCSPGSGFLLRPSAATTKCTPPVARPASPADDCSVAACCTITCGFAPCSGQPGYVLKASANTIPCPGAVPASCTAKGCCDALPCSPAKAPTITGATVDCTEATSHGETCRVTSQAGYTCTGAVTCTPQSSVGGGYSSSLLCTLAHCPSFASPPQCACDPGYSGTPQWNGNLWTHTCSPKPCTCTAIPNSRLYSSPGSLCGSAGDSVVVVCLDGYTASAGTAVCQGETLTFTPVHCSPNTCLPTHVPNSVEHSVANSVRGTTGTRIAIACKAGYIGSGKGCPDNCVAECDGSSFSSVTCSGAPCPRNSGPAGECTCKAGYATEHGTPPTWSGKEWVHECKATCGLYTCTSDHFTLKQPPVNFLCSGPSAGDCNDSLCCRGARINPISGLTTTEGGGRATFSIALVSRPTAAVTVGLQSTNTAEGTVSTSTVVFTPSNWDTAQTITITGVDDHRDDGDQLFTIATSAVVSADGNFNGLKFHDISVTNKDDDSKGIVVTPTTGLHTSEAGGTATYTVVLRSQPSAPVTIPLNSSNPLEGKPSVGLLIFTPASWSVKQTVTVTGVDDDVNDGDVGYSIRHGVVTSEDAMYRGIALPDVSVTNADDDSRGVEVNPTSGLTTTEGGGKATFTMRLTSRPTAAVIIGVRSSDPSEGSLDVTSISFAPDLWNVPQTVTVTGMQDKVNDDAVSYSIVTEAVQSADVRYHGYDPQDVTVTNMDDDYAGLSMTPTSGMVTSEGGDSTSFAVVLNSQPTSPVILSIFTSSNEAAVNPSTFTVTVVDWNVPRHVTVTGVDDYTDDGDQDFAVSLSVVSRDPKYNGYTPSTSVTGTNRDDDTAGVVVAPTAGLTTSESGGTANFTVRLTSAPIATVTIEFVGDTAEGVLTPQTVSFSSVDWNTTKTITVTGVDDHIDDGDKLYTVRALPVVSSDAKYRGITLGGVTVTNKDNDARGVRVTPHSGLSTTELGGRCFFTLVLESEPLADVTIPVASGDESEGSVAPSAVHFSQQNWSTPATVTVTGVQDELQDGDVVFTVTTGGAVSADPSYRGYNPTDVVVVNRDDDTPGIAVTPLSGLVTTEKGGSATFTLSLSSIPLAAVTVPISPEGDEVEVMPRDVTFTKLDWNTPQTVTVTGVDDHTADGNMSFRVVIGPGSSSDSNYNALDAPDVWGVNIDDDVASITVEAESTPLITTEGGRTAHVVVAMRSQPLHPVQVHLSGQPAEGVIDPVTVTFNASTWNIPATVTVRGVDDIVADGNVTYDIVVHPAVSNDHLYSGMDPPDIPVVNLDNDTAGVSVTPVTPLTTTEAGGEAKVEVSLASKPLGSVTIPVNTSHPTEGVARPMAIVFTPDSWNVVQTITVTGQGDLIDDGNVTYSLILSPCISTDRSYHGLDPQDVEVTNSDDDKAGITVHPVNGTVTELGGKFTFSIVLDTEPTADVTIGVVSGDLTEGTVEQSSVVFTPATWSTSKTVTVVGVDDVVADGNVSFTVSTVPAVSADPRYDGLNPANVVVVNVDNDVAGVEVLPTKGLQTTEAGGVAVFTVRLATEPIATVTIPITSNNTAEGTAHPAKVAFTPGNWNVAQSVTVTGVDDTLDDGDVAFRVVVGAAVSSDTAYQGLAGSYVEVVNTDDDVPGVSVAPVQGLTCTEAGGSATFTVSLASTPSGEVLLGISSSDASEGVVNTPQLRFTPANWDVPQTVTVTGVDDKVDDGDIPFTITTSSLVSTDSKYNGINPPDVAVTNKDDDTAGMTVTPSSGVTTEGGGTSHFTVVLTSRPTAAVTVGISSSDTTEGTVSPREVVFTPTTWDVEKTITVTGVPDDLDDGDVVYTVATSAAVSSDGKYDGLNADDVRMTNTDDDVVGVVVRPQSGLVTSEGGASAYFVVTLSSEPYHEVTIPIASSDLSEGTVIPSSVTFAPGAWSTQQTVTVTGVDDDTRDGHVPYHIEFGSLQSADGGYADLSIPAVTVTNTDNDTASVVVGGHGNLTTSENGGTTEVVMYLSSKPTADVTVWVESNDVTEGVVDPSRLVFTAAKWKDAQTVTVTGVDDAVDDGDVVYHVQVVSVVSVDPYYHSIPTPRTALTNLNDDFRGCTVRGSPVAVSEKGESGVITLSLDSQPTAGVVVSVESSNPREGVVFPQQLLFTASDWSTPQSVTVQGIPDGVTDGDTSFTVVFHPLLSVDPLYRGLQLNSVTVTNRDVFDECSIAQNICKTAGQRCVDPDVSPQSLNNWECHCTGSSTGSARGGVADCKHSGECLANAPTCTGRQQGCRDTNLTAADDWECFCLHPEVGEPSSASPAVCTLDECLVVTQCAAAGQECVDTNLTVTGTWECRCREPLVGSAVGKVASCSERGECAVHAHICTARGQTCHDPSNAAEDWECVCPQPAVGRALRGVATCLLDECTVHGAVCGAQGQQCHDPNTSLGSLADWVCECVGSQAEGRATAMPAMCLHDECQGNTVCKKVGQLCHDPNHMPGSTQDWECRCPLPAEGRRVGGPATCTFIGECTVNSPVCTEAGQTCYDANLSTLGDWECVCVPPNMKKHAAGKPALCELDECTLHGTVCEAVGQRCRDQNTSPEKTNDWRCECVAPAEGMAVGRAAVCMHKGECAVHSATCAAAGQSCEDRNPAKEGDWECKCNHPMTGRKVGGPAECVVDECHLHGSVCSQAGQICTDPNTSPLSRHDWECSCAPPALGRALGRAAVCAFHGECAAQAGVCTARGQTCHDPDDTLVGDWKCLCVAPSKGSAVGGPAKCVLDECTAHSHVCTAVDQRCVDPDTSPASTGDWLCECVGGVATGRAVGLPAVCMVDECWGHGDVCYSEGQACRDTNTSPASSGDWQCECPPPSAGAAVAKPAVCTFDGECSQHAAACTAAGQTCFDPDPFRNGDWECVCVSPRTGRATGKPAMCSLDECLLHGKVCHRKGQACHDPNKSPEATGDWECRCIGSSEGTAVAKAALCTHAGECAVHHPVCTSAGQGCRDPDVTRIDDWECLCVEPLTGKATMKEASCVIDECTLHAHVCFVAGQKCYDPNTSPNSRDDWECSCVGSAATGTATARPAMCLLDECTLHGRVCTSVGQKCRDPNKGPASTGDWRCECVAPATGVGLAEAAACTYGGECSVYAPTCTSAGQTCTDPDPTPGNWRCECVAPQRGSAVGQAAHCVLDECTTHGKVCHAAGQTCHDPDKSPGVTGDWVCRCLSPAIGERRGHAAACAYQGECTAHASVCTAAGQGCVDPSEHTMGDWLCACVPPQSGTPSKGGGALCILDECVVHGDVCTAKGQLCKDPDTDPASIGDWKCHCPPPAIGEAVGGPAQCTFEGECATHSGVCTAVGQSCIDPNPTTTDDWECVCVGAQRGRGRGQPAQCTLDECTIHGNVCTKAAQQCVDKAPHPSKTGDWECRCLGSSVGSAVAKAASCAYSGGCAKNSDVCTAKGQACYLPDPAAPDSWRCVCIAPQTGSAAATPAECTLDECTVHGGVCTAVGQLCRDPNHDPTTTGDWYCECVAPATGTAVGKAASCDFPGECAASAHLCVAAGQTCRDPDTAKKNDWMCACVEPALGTATGSRAVCDLDECIANHAVCAAFGQLCIDPTPTAAITGDWMCQCVGSAARGTARSQPAVCLLDECEEHKGVCTAAGQECRDPNPNPASRGDWQCVCVGAGSGVKRMQVATCTHVGECATHSTVCTGAGQACYDPDPTKDGDWECKCVAPFSGLPSKGAPASCSYDECRTSTVCEEAGQLCVDPDQRMGQTGDWSCHCPPPMRGSAVGKPATCLFEGECAANAVVCTSVGQTCRDPNLEMEGDWECECIAPQTGSPSKGGAAMCILDECTLHGSVCTAVGQTCHDPNTSPLSPNDWTCDCVHPAVGRGVLDPAQCVHQGECTVHHNTCSAEGQTCYDPSPKANDWQCVCLSPSSGRASGGPAVCTQNECLQHSVVCSSAGQLCHDPNPSPSSTGDWECRCPSPAVGVARAAAAKCVYESECALHSEKCHQAGQSCHDPDRAKIGDWQCVCLAPMTGRATAKAASCTLDECVQHGDTCKQAGQKCSDPTPTISSRGDWECLCPTPSIGRAVGRPADCILDECLQNSVTCTAAGQTCEDRDKKTEGDWRCRCLDPLEGSAVGGVAVCTLDECTAKGRVCREAGQTCLDKNTSPDLTGDWMCVCHGSTGSAVGAPATCAHPSGECREVQHICAQAGQACHDPSPTLKGDWECVCLEPEVGSATGTTASCVLDECSIYSDICSGQRCVDPNTSPQSTGDWRCECIAPAKGSRVREAAHCVADECASDGVVCLAAGQRCVDPNKDPASKGDWVCECTGSSTGSAVGEVAACKAENECVEHAAACIAAGQACVDPNPSVSGDWRCVCVPPAVHIASADSAGKLAACSFDECTLHSEICHRVGQVCHDSDTSVTSLGDWTCRCSGLGVGEGRPAVCQHSGVCSDNAAVCTAAGQGCFQDGNVWECRCLHPAVGRGRMNPATCLLDECAVHGAVCTDAGQQCVDPNLSPSSTGDWMCVCTGPHAEGSAVGAVAVCTVDECSEHAAVCLARGQACIDPQPSASSTGDWECHCQGAAVGSATRKPAQCTYSGECQQHGEGCASQGQACFDPSSANGDWGCMCTAPYKGRAANKAAVCTFDECTKHWRVCSEVGQLCLDRNQSSASVGDWECECPSPASGKRQGAPATCTAIGACSTHGAVCTAAGQRCEEGEAAGEWRCHCVYPYSGTPSVGGRAQCLLDECVVSGYICHSAGQTCHDPNHDPGRLADWGCSCVPPATGTATARTAECTHLGECTVHASTCTAAGQACDDPSAEKSGDWRCLCVPPAVGSATSKVAECVLDECTLHRSVCSAAGQTCLDVDTRAESTGDWMCLCTETEGKAVGKPAVCYKDECRYHGEVCREVGQQCLDRNMLTVGDWSCTCTGSGKGVQQGAPAQCTYEGECDNAAVRDVCTQSGQACYDPNPAVMNDWKCLCLSPGAGEAVGRTARCTVDECLLHHSACTDKGQQCRDPDLTVLGDWECRCGGAGKGIAKAQPALCTYAGSCRGNYHRCEAKGMACEEGPHGWQCTCLTEGCFFDECATHRQVCAAAGQECHDPHPEQGRLGDWECRCGGGGVGVGKMKAALCTFTGACEAHHSVCTSVGQACHNRGNSWECRCVSPQEGRGDQSPAAVCSALGECLTNHLICKAAGQLCSDPNPSRLGDWECVCPSPYLGTAVGAPAVCSAAPPSPATAKVSVTTDGRLAIGDVLAVLHDVLGVLNDTVFATSFTMRTKVSRGAYREEGVREGIAAAINTLASGERDPAVGTPMAPENLVLLEWVWGDDRGLSTEEEKEKAPTVEVASSLWEVVGPLPARTAWAEALEASAVELQDTEQVAVIPGTLSVTSPAPPNDTLAVTSLRTSRTSATLLVQQAAYRGVSLSADLRDKIDDDLGLGKASRLAGVGVLAAAAGGDCLGSCPDTQQCEADGTATDGTFRCLCPDGMAAVNRPADCNLVATPLPTAADSKLITITLRLKAPVDTTALSAAVADIVAARVSDIYLDGDKAILTVAADADLPSALLAEQVRNKILADMSRGSRGQLGGKGLEVFAVQAAPASPVSPPPLSEPSSDSGVLGMSKGVSYGVIAAIAVVLIPLCFLCARVILSKKSRGTNQPTDIPPTPTRASDLEQPLTPPVHRPLPAPPLHEGEAVDIPSYLPRDHEGVPIPKKTLPYCTPPPLEPDTVDGLPSPPPQVPQSATKSTSGWV